jgi:hypothetical protein
LAVVQVIIIAYSAVVQVFFPIGDTSTVNADAGSAAHSARVHYYRPARFVSAVYAHELVIIFVKHYFFDRHCRRCSKSLAALRQSVKQVLLLLGGEHFHRRLVVRL